MLSRFPGRRNLREQRTGQTHADRRNSIRRRIPCISFSPTCLSTAALLLSLCASVDVFQSMFIATLHLSRCVPSLDSGLEFGDVLFIPLFWTWGTRADQLQDIVQSLRLVRCLCSAYGAYWSALGARVSVVIVVIGLTTESARKSQGRHTIDTFYD